MSCQIYHIDPSLGASDLGLFVRHYCPLRHHDWGFYWASSSSRRRWRCQTERQEGGPASEAPEAASGKRPTVGNFTVSGARSCRSLIAIDTPQNMFGLGLSPPPPPPPPLLRTSFTEIEILGCYQHALNVLKHLPYHLETLNTRANFPINHEVQPSYFTES